jgi:hypothetical protein
MATPSAYIAKVLEKESFGSVGSDIFTGADMPPTPDNMIMIVDTRSRPDFPSLPINMCSFQVTVRGVKGSSQVTFDKADRINQFLQFWSGYIENTRFVYINNVSGSPFSLGVDDNMRPLFTVNYQSMKSYNVYK